MNEGKTWKNLQLHTNLWQDLNELKKEMNVKSLQDVLYELIAEYRKNQRRIQV